MSSDTSTKKVVESKVILSSFELTDDKNNFRQRGVKLVNAVAHVEKPCGWAMERAEECPERGRGRGW